MNNMKTQTKLPGFLLELEQVLSDDHDLLLDSECTGGIAPLGEDEKLIGTVPEGITRILYLVSRYYDLRAAEQKIVFEFAADGSKAELLAQSLGVLYKERADTYRTMFWTTVHDTYPPGKGYKGLSLRQGWALTETPDEDTAVMSLIQLLRGGR